MNTKLSNRLIQTYISASMVIMATPVIAAPIPLADSPLFLSNSQKANVLVILDNSNSMDEDASGAAVGSGSPLSKSEIARTAVRNLITTYTGKINMGLMAYQQTNVSHRNLDNSPYDASYDPANYDPTFTGDRGSLTKRFRMEQADNPGSFIYYNVALPFYHTGGNIGDTMYCYSDQGPDPEPRPYNFTVISGLGKHYRCFHHKNGISDARVDSAYLNYWFNGSFGPTDSDLAQGITGFGSHLASVQVSPTWFSNSSPGRGYLHTPITDLDLAQANLLNTKLAVSQFVSNGPTNPTLSLQNAGLTPIEGTLLTAKDYFEGNLSAPNQGGPQAAPAESCGKNFIAFMTDGLPSTDKNGNTLTNPTTAINAVTTAAASLLSTSIGIKNKGVETYMIGFALPFGVDPTTLNQVAAAGGTGSAYLANNPASLQAAFDTIFTDILTKSGASSSAATNSTALSLNSHIYQAKFNSDGWSGQLISKSINTSAVIASSADWDSGLVINTQAPSDREIMTYSRDSRDGMAFQWSAISAQTDTTQADFLNRNAAAIIDSKGSDRVNYLRGDSVSGFRTRTSKLGDIINSTPSYIGAPAAGYNDTVMPGYTTFRTTYLNRTPIIYVGANDGMLHGFDASNGQEKMAYVPGSVYAHLSDLTDPGYGQGGFAHRYSVDGSPIIADANLGSDGSPNWKTVLTAGLNSGGSGYYALDVTDPSTFSEANAANAVLWEFTDEDDADLGFTFNQAILNRETNQAGQIARMQDGRWALIVGNGYNNTVTDGNSSSTGNAVLYILFLQGPTGVSNTWQLGTDYIKIDTKAGSIGTPNGLATPRPIDTDDDGRVDTIYAGDLLGNLWKFDVSSNTTPSSTWKVAYGSTLSPAPLFTAMDSSSNVQPITTAPIVRPNTDSGGYIIGFATGKYLGISDLSSTDTQTLYGIWDNGASVSGRSDLVEQTILAELTLSSGVNARITSHNVVDYTSKKGWYMDLPTSGERVAFNPIFPSNGRFIFTTLIPDTGLCANGGSSWLMVLDYRTGGGLPASPFVHYGSKVNYTDANGDPQSDYVVGLMISDILTTPTVIKDPGQNQEHLVGSTSSGGMNVFSLTTPLTGQRSAWREVFR
ncbi:MAG: PilC/PilY family type IV pilus protein [Methylococcales bacterium]